MERILIHCLVKSCKHARSSSTLILANSTGGRVQYCPFLVVLVLEHRLAMPCCLHNSPRHLSFPLKEAWAHEQRGKSAALPQVPWRGCWGNWHYGWEHGAFLSASRVQLVHTGREEERLHWSCKSCLWLSAGCTGLHQLRTPAQLVR